MPTSKTFWLLAGLLVAGLIFWLLNPGWLASLQALLSTDTIEAVAAYVRSFGIWAPLASIGLMMLQAIIMPLPSVLVAAANGAIFGVWWGTLLSWLGGLAGGSLAFWLAHSLGAAYVARKLGQAQLDRLAMLREKGGFWTILLARLIPGLSFDLISYLAGLSGISYGRFLLATAIGMLPGTAMFTILGHDLARAGEYSWRLSLIGLLGVVGYLVGLWWYRKK